MVLKKLKPGMIVYDVKKSTRLRTFISKFQTWQVQIIKINYENQTVLASWSGNPPQWFGKFTWSKWRLKRPEEKQG